MGTCLDCRRRTTTTEVDVRWRYKTIDERCERCGAPHSHEKVFEAEFDG